MCKLNDDHDYRTYLSLMVVLVIVIVGHLTKLICVQASTHSITSVSILLDKLKFVLIHKYSDLYLFVDLKIMNE